MDYSLLVGIHDCDQIDSPEPCDSFDIDEDDEEELANSGGNSPGMYLGGGNLSPPDSPGATFCPPVFSGELDKSMESFAIKCSDR